MRDENVLTIAHQNGPQALTLMKGGYCIENGRLAVSIETDNPDSEGWPPCALFSMHNCPIDGELSVGDTFECDGGMHADNAEVDGATKANAYSTFHAEKVYVKWTVAEVRRDLVVFNLEARHDDTDYYDERAAECPTTGVFALPKKRFNELWIPF